MSKYTDAASYRLAVRVRSYKTVLVEGVTDKQVVASFFLTHNALENITTPFFVDDVSIISDTSFAGLGNKQKALQIATSMQNNKDKLICLVDREWDGVDFTNLPNSLQHPHNHAMVTKGHSIENYWFHEEALTSFLIQSYPEKININFLNSICENFNAILKLSASYSLAAKDSSLISRLGDLISYTDLRWNGASFSIAPSFNTKLQARQINLDFATMCNTRLNQLPTQSSDDLRWLCHGHLGEQAIRACAAALANVHGIDDISIIEIERGNKPGKFHHDISYINQRPPASLTPLDEILGWMRR